MRKHTSLLLACLLLTGGAGLFSACDDDETYAEKKERENKTINAFLKTGTCVLEETTGDTLLYVPPINWIDEEQFAAQDSTTYLDQNQYVLLRKTGIYMQIVRKGSGEKLANGETATVINRYVEFNIASDSIQSRNDNLYYVAVSDEMSCTNSYGTLTGSFISGVMKTRYGASVPEGWLVPLAYINLGRDLRDLAKVRLIVPHNSGQDNASQNIYACFYEITYQRGR